MRKFLATDNECPLICTIASVAVSEEKPPYRKDKYKFT